MAGVEDSAHEHSNRRPDEEGIKTSCSKASRLLERDSNRRPDEEGIKTERPLAGETGGEHSNRRPDEEGIKTEQDRRGNQVDHIPTADLMKKGLRPPVTAQSIEDEFQPQT